MAIENKLQKNLEDFFNLYNGDFQIYYIERGDKNDKGEYIYQSNYCTMGKLNITLSDDYKTSLFNIVNDKDIVDFDVESENGENIEILKSDKVNELKNIKPMLDEFNSNRASAGNFDVSKIWGCAIVFKNNKNEKLTLFRKYTIPKSLQETRKLAFLKLKNKQKNIGELELIESDIISLDLKIDSFELNGVVYIISKYYFHLFFNYMEAYTKFVDDSLEEMKKVDIIDNFDDFCIRCKESFNLTKKMVKIINEDKLKLLKDNIDSAKKVIVSHDLKIEVNEKQNKIIFNKKCKIKDFMNLLCGNCILDAINYEKGIANSVKKLPHK